MAKRYIQYRYTVELTYLNIADNTGTEIKNECIKTIIIDHNIDKLSMPLVYLTLKLDKSLIDHMIKYCNDNLFALALFKYDDLTDSKEEIECFRKKFTYFLPNDLNKNDAIDYNDANSEEHMENTYKTISMGLLCLDHVNNNKQSMEINAKMITMSDIVKHVMASFNPLIMETFPNNEIFEQFVLPVQDSVKKTLMALNDYRVFYDTPYRYYQDFNHSYLISSSGKGIPKSGEKHNSVVIDIQEATDLNSRDLGFIDNTASGAYEIAVNYNDTQIFDNTIANKSKSSIQGVTSSSATKTSLANTASYSNEKTVSTRLNNDNTNMMSNLEADSNNNNFFVYFSKNDLDTDIFSINKKISVKHIDRYQEQNGEYLLYRKREIYTREDESFLLTTMVNLRKIG